jgi:SAM-dependent methyltransferase
MRAVLAQRFQGAFSDHETEKDIWNVECCQAFTNVDTLLSVFEDLGRPIGKDDSILDFGCGEGRMVYAFRKLGYNAFGADIVPPSPEVEERLRQDGLSSGEEKLLRTSPVRPHRLPFDDDHFGFVVSWDVMEHVQDHQQALSEISRVLKPYGRSLHFFPARYRFLEPHVHVPLGTLFRGHAYLYFWALMGVRTRSQKYLTAKEIARKNYEFLRTETKYLSKKCLKEIAHSYFGNVDFVERHFWKHNGGKSGLIYKALSNLGLQRAIPVAANMLSPFGYRAVFFFKPPRERGLAAACGCPPR